MCSIFSKLFLGLTEAATKKSQNGRRLYPVMKDKHDITVYGDNIDKAGTQGGNIQVRV